MQNTLLNNKLNVEIELQMMQPMYKEEYVYDMLNKLIEKTVVLQQRMVNVECLKKKGYKIKICIKIEMSKIPHLLFLPGSCSGELVTRWWILWWCFHHPIDIPPNILAIKIPIYESIRYECVIAKWPASCAVNVNWCQKAPRHIADI